MEIPFLNLSALNQHNTKAYIKIITKILKNGQFILGDEVRKFEESFSKFIGVKYCIAVGNGLNALELIQKAYDFQQKSEIIVPANTFYATILSIINCGYKPVLIEPDINTLNIDTKLIESKISAKTKAILPVHLYGRIADMETIINIAKKHNLIIIEDVAQAHGASYKGKYAGNLGHAAAFSFYPTKNLGAFGDAGAITTNDPEIYEKIICMRNYGFSNKNYSKYLGTNSRMDELQAAILSYKLKKLTNENNKRIKIAEFYQDKIHNQFIKKPLTSLLNEHVWHLYTLRTIYRDIFDEYLRHNGIETSIHYPLPPHKQTSLRIFSKIKLPITEEIHNEIISIPLNPALQTKELNYIVNCINNFMPNFI